MKLSEEPSNTIECPRCGAEVYYEINSCPKCGWNFFAPDKNESEPASPSIWAGVSWKGIFSGLAAVTLAFYWLNLGLQKIYPSGDLPPAGRWYLAAIALVAGGIGGYVAGVVAGKNWRLHGGVIALVAAFLAVLFDGFWFPSPLRLDVAVGVVLAVFAAMAAARWIVGRQERKNLEILFFPKKSEENLYRDLMAKVQYDQPTAERLIEFERRRAPRAKRRDWIENAINRWMKDNR